MTSRAPHVQAPPPPPVVAPALPGALTTPAPLPVGERLRHGAALAGVVAGLWTIGGALAVLLYQPDTLSGQLVAAWILVGLALGGGLALYWLLLPLRHERAVTLWEQAAWDAQLDDARQNHAANREAMGAYADYWLHEKAPTETERVVYMTANGQTIAVPSKARVQVVPPDASETRPLPALLTTPPPWQLTLWAIVEGVRGRAVSERNLPPTVSKATYQEALACLHAVGVVDTPRNKPPRLAAAWTRYTDDPAAADMQVARLLEGRG